MFKRVFLASLLATAAACGSNAATDPGADAGVDAAPAITGLGNSCATGCIGSDICANTDADCEHGYCLFDGREDFESYCTMDCSATDCPAGYTCETVPFEIHRACVANPRVCGNGIVERGEACDDGNTVSDDGCRADCNQIDTPLGEQQRLHASMTVSGTYTPKSGAATPFSMSTTVDSQIGGSFDCGKAATLGGNSGPPATIRFNATGCDAGIELQLGFDTPFVVGSFPTPDGYASPRVCAYLFLPAPDNARLWYCAQTGAQSLVVESASATPKNAAGHFSATLTYQPDESIGGCDGFYAPNTCPAVIPPTITVTGTFAATNLE